MGTNVAEPVAVSRRGALVARAKAKAVEQSMAGNLPTLLRSRFDGAAISELWSVGSRTTGGTVYVIDARRDADGLQTICECEAAHAGRICWHRAAARMASNDELPFHRAPGVVRFKPLQRRPVAPARPRVTAAELSLQPAYV